LLILTLGCLWLYYGRCSQHVLLKNVALAIEIKMPTQGTFSKRYRKLQKYLENAVDKVWNNDYNSAKIRRLAIDSFPIERSSRMLRFRKKKKRSKAKIGYISSQKTHFYGFRLHWLMSISGKPFKCKILAGEAH